MTLFWVSRNRAITSWKRIMTAAAPSGAWCGWACPFDPLADGAGSGGCVSVLLIGTRGVTGVTEEGTCGLTGAAGAERGTDVVPLAAGAGLATGGVAGADLEA